MSHLFYIGLAFIGFAVWKLLRTIWRNDLSTHSSAPGNGVGGGDGGVSH